jgi:hypothetical protein
MKTCAAACNATAPADRAKTTYLAYSSACMKNRGPKPAAPMTPQDRVKACAAKWNALKAANKTGGQTYQQFSSVCLKAS